MEKRSVRYEIKNLKVSVIFFCHSQVSKNMNDQLLIKNMNSYLSLYRCSCFLYQVFHENKVNLNISNQHNLVNLFVIANLDSRETELET